MHCRQVKIKSGLTWECFADAPRNPVTGKRRMIKRRGRTRGVATKRVNDAINELLDSNLSGESRKIITFEQLVDKWFKVYDATGVKRNTIRIREAESNILKRYFAKSPVKRITHHMYQSALIDLDNKKYAKSSISGVNTCANLVFEYAVRIGLIKYNPANGAVIPKRTMTIEELEGSDLSDTHFESYELDLFLNEVIKRGLRIDKELFFTLAFSGMRPGELVSLKKNDLNFEDNTVRISKTMHNENNSTKNYMVTTTKTNQMRTIGVSSQVMQMLKVLVHHNDKHKMKYRTLLDDFHDKDFVFQRENGYPYSTLFIARRMKRVLKLIKFKKHLTPHSFRHTHITMLAESGTELSTIMERVGHVDPNTTLKVYTHVTDKMKSESMDKMSLSHGEILNKLTL